MGSNPVPHLINKERNKMNYWNQATKITKLLDVLAVCCVFLTFHDFVTHSMEKDPLGILNLLLCVFWIRTLYNQKLSWDLYKLRMVDNPDPDRKFV